MEVNMRCRGVSVESKEISEEIKKCRKALKRVIEDKYFEKKLRRAEIKKDIVDLKIISQMAFEEKEKDINFVFNSMKKNVFKWWD